jgi:hypothetical protein
MKQRAHLYGATIRAEKGGGNAVKIIKQYFGEPGTSESECYS